MNRIWKLLIALVVLVATQLPAQDVDDDAIALLQKADEIEAAALDAYRTAMTEADALREQASLLVKHEALLTPEAKAAIRQNASNARRDRLTARAEKALEERRAMKARGEDIEVPRNVAEMKAILEAQESELEAEAEQE